MDVIPISALARLPLKAVAVSAWAEHDDLHSLLRDLYANYEAYGDDLFREGRIDADKTAVEWTFLARAVMPAAAAEGNTDESPDFRGDLSFGLAWKHLIAWRALVEALLSESAFYSIGHTLETRADVEASFHLVGHFYYKQALQVLRGFIEDAVLPLWFAMKPQEFVDWRLGKGYRIPPMQTRAGAKERGMLPALRDDGQISEHLERSTSEVYGNLNGAIHAQERRLIHRGFDRDQYRGEVFKRDDFDEWCQKVADVVTVGVELLSVNESQLHVLRRQHAILCDVCHNWEDFLITRDRSLSGSGDSVTFHCRVCEQDITYSGEFAAKHWPSA